MILQKRVANMHGGDALLHKESTGCLPLSQGLSHHRIFYRIMRNINEIAAGVFSRRV
jgi:hypothetical protein